MKTSGTKWLAQDPSSMQKGVEIVRGSVWAEVNLSKLDTLNRAEKICSAVDPSMAISFDV